MLRGAVYGALALATAACASARGDDALESAQEDPNEAFSGGRATVFDTSRMAFAQPVPGLAGEREDEFFIGNSIFNRAWVAAPASVAKFDGLGPVFNATTCSGCHFKDGRGQPPEKSDEPFVSLLLRLSVPGDFEHGAPRPDPTYGGQIQGNGILGIRAEGREEVTYEEVHGSFADGEVYALLRPSYRVVDLASGPLARDVMVSPRVAPGVYGLGLLEAVPEATLLALADPDDRNADGISGRPNWVWDARLAKRAIGRFGWKANQPTVEQQTAGAFNGDMGITSSLFPSGDCMSAQSDCNASPSGGSPELDDALLSSTVTYAHLLAVPARRRWTDEMVRRGKEIFATLGCQGCHVSKLTTGDVPSFPELSKQTIRSYTDLLLHDMGAELADGRPDFEATGTEWRTPPLWGIGLVQTVNRHTRFLHDGRARSLLEAVLWHSGEADRSRAAFKTLAKADRDAVLSFLESL